MASKDNLTIAQTFLQRLADGAPVSSICELFAADVVWNIPGNEAAYPWIGKQHGHEAVIQFISESSQRLQRTHFEVHDILANECRVMIYGELASLDLVTKKSMATPFVIVLDIVDSLIQSFLMMENSVAISEASQID